MTLTAEQHAIRDHGIGSSDCAAAIGVSPYKTPLQLYLEKTGEIEAEDLDEVERVQWGNILEDPIAREYARRRGVKIQRVNITQVHPEHAFMVSHIDRRVVGERRILECKNVGQFYGAKAFGEEYTDQVPDVYLVQVMHQMIVNNIPDADLAALIGGNRMKTFRFQFDDELAEIILYKCAVFWKHVTTNTPPPPSSVSDLEILYAEDNGQIKTVDASVFALWEQYHDANEDLKAKQEHVDGLKDRLRFAIAESAGIQFEPSTRSLPAPGEPDAPGIEYAGKPLATWKAQQRRTIDSKRLKAEKPEIYQEYLKTSASRVLRITKR